MKCTTHNGRRLSAFGRILLLCGCIVLTLATVAAAVVGYAYFSKREIYEGYAGVKVELLFGKLEDSALADYQTNVLGLTESPVEPRWGSRENPYIIENIKHLNNLAELQPSIA